MALIDGEHYAPVVRDALAEIPHDVVGALLVGGTEKLMGGDEYGVPLADDLEEALSRFDPEVAVDVSDEPVLGPRERFRLASRFLALGIAYEGADFSLRVPEYEPFDLPSLAVIGTGKRLGKTAVTGYAARLLADERDLVVVSMGRGGPAEPQVADLRPTVEDLLELAREARMRRRTTSRPPRSRVSRRSAAGAPAAGSPGCRGRATSPRACGRRSSREPELVIFDGSGAAIPPVATRKRVLVAGAHQPPELVVGYLNAYRILVSDLVVLTMAEDGTRHQELAEAVREVKDVPVVATVLRPRPVEPVEGKRVAFFTTADASATELLAGHLRDEHGAADVTISCNLSRREQLRDDVQRADADVFVVEIKAAAIDVVARAPPSGASRSCSPTTT